jgi:hypothetical protein
LYCFTVGLGVVLTLGDLLATLPSFHLATLTFLPVLLAAIRGGLRVAAVIELLPSARSQIMSQAWIYLVLSVCIPFLYLVNFAASLTTRKTRWRGVTYELISPEHTRILGY